MAHRRALPLLIPPRSPVTTIGERHILRRPDILHNSQLGGPLVDDLNRIAADVTRIRKDVDSILHGNGRKGVWALSDAVFGPPGCAEDGLVKRVALIERATRESRLLQRGIAIGVGLVLVEGAFNINLARLVAAWFGGGS